MYVHDGTAQQYYNQLEYGKDYNKDEINNFKDQPYGLELGNVQAGVAAFLIGLIAGILAHDKIRIKKFELFIKSHWILMSCWFILLMFHSPNIRVFLGAIGVIHLLDILFRMITSK